jgi:hypothetical protein
LAVIGAVERPDVRRKLMDNDRRNIWFSIPAAGGLILGLAFVAYELRQNSELMRVQINQARADAAMASNDQFFNSDYLPSILLKIDIGEELSDEEWMRYVSWFRASNRNQDNVIYQYHVGMLDENTPQSVGDFVRNVVASSEYAQSAWELTKVGYTKEYVSFVEKILREGTQQ